METKYNLYLENPSFDITQDCGDITAEQIKTYIQELTNFNTIPQESCLSTLGVQFCSRNGQRYYLCGDPRHKPKLCQTDNGWMTLKINIKCCRKCPTEDCLRNIQSGKCTDDFAREIIGEKLFADKYNQR